MNFSWCQRWNEGQHSWRHRSEGGFDASRYDVAPIDELSAKRFITTHHYSGTYPATRFRYGLHVASSGELVGVGVLSVPVQAKVLTNIFPGLVPYNESIDLGRFALLDSVAANGETFFLGRLFRLAAAEGVRGVVSFSDPLPRLTADGRVVMPGHAGIIYQAMNARYTGRSTAESLVLLPDGSSLNRRAMQKVRGQERGHEHVERRLIELGARPLRGQRPAAWLAEALSETGARRVRHKGNHRYAFAIGPQRRLVAIAPIAHTYPKQPDRIAA